METKETGRKVEDCAHHGDDGTCKPSGNPCHRRTTCTYWKEKKGRAEKKETFGPCWRCVHWNSTGHRIEEGFDGGSYEVYPGYCRNEKNEEDFDTETMQDHECEHFEVKP